MIVPPVPTVKLLIVLPVPTVKRMGSLPTVHAIRPQVSILLITSTLHAI